jgi:pimeloyl-[acyl-carrier protein] methyl ester esterase
LASFVLLPGLDGTGKLFDRLLAVIGGSHAFTVVRYPESVASLNDLVAFARAAIDRVENPIVIAESFSGVLLARLLSERKIRMRAAVFAASFMETPRRYLLPGALRVPETVARVAMAALIKHFCVNGCDDAALREEIFRVVDSAPYRTLLTRLALLRDLEERVIETVVPVLALQATQDRVLDRSARSSIKRRIPGARIEMVEGPHLLLQAEPVACWRVIESFMRDVGYRRPMPGVARRQVTFFCFAKRK